MPESDEQELQILVASRTVLDAVVQLSENRNANPDSVAAAGFFLRALTDTAAGIDEISRDTGVE